MTEAALILHEKREMLFIIKRYFCSDYRVQVRCFRGLPEPDRPGKAVMVGNCESSVTQFLRSGHE